MENKISRRTFLTASAAVAMTAALSACGATPTATPTKAPPTATKAAAAVAPTAPAAPTAAPKATIEAIVTRGQSAAQPMVNDAPAHLEMTKATGVKLNFQVVPDSDYTTKQTLYMSTKQVPDLMRSSFAALTGYADPSVFKPVLPLIDKVAPNIKKFIDANANDVKRMKIGGDLFIVPSTSCRTKLLAPMPMIRKDLVEKAGLKMPTTFDELYTVLKELKKANPDTLGWTARRPSTPSGIKRELMIVAYPFGSGLGGWAGASTPSTGKRRRTAARGHGGTARFTRSSRTP